MLPILYNEMELKDIQIEFLYFTESVLEDVALLSRCVLSYLFKLS